MTETVYGTKYAETKGLTRVEIAKKIREDIKAERKAGTLPKAKYSVTTESYSGGGSIDISVKDVEGIAVHNPESLLWHHDFPHAAYRSEPEEARAPYSKEMTAALAKLEEIHASYNYDGSDSMTDYFHVRFYGDAKIGWEYADAKKNEEIAGLLEERALKKGYKAEAAAEAAAEVAFHDAEKSARESAKTAPKFVATVTTRARHLALVKAPEPESANDHAAYLEHLGVL